MFATSSPTSDLCEADDDVQDGKNMFSSCTHPQMVSLRRKCTYLFSQFRMCLLFLRQTTNCIFSFMNLIYSTNKRAVILLA